MAAAAGILFTDALDVGGVQWYESGKLDYGFPVPALLAIQFLVMGFLETTRYDGWKKTGKVTFPVFPERQSYSVWTSLS